MLELLELFYPGTFFLCYKISVILLLVSLIFFYFRSKNNAFITRINFVINFTALAFSFTALAYSILAILSLTKDDWEGLATAGLAGIMVLLILFSIILVSAIIFALLLVLDINITRRYFLTKPASRDKKIGLIFLKCFLAIMLLIICINAKALRNTAITEHWRVAKPLIRIEGVRGV